MRLMKQIHGGNKAEVNINTPIFIENADSTRTVPVLFSHILNLKLYSMPIMFTC